MRHWIIYLCMILIPTSIGCQKDDNGKRVPDPEEVCQEPGQSVAERIKGDGIYLDGPNAVGGGGDFLLQNDHAAYIIQGVDRGITYYHYGGILVDAVAMNGCNQITEDHFEEAGFLIGELDMGEIYNSSLRAFRAEEIEIINDGSDGSAAIVRATGVDDYYWLVEYVFILAAVGLGDSKPLSQPYGIKLQVDYILPPDSPVLRIELKVVNKDDERKQLLSAILFLFGDATEISSFAKSGIEVSGFSFLTEIPWLTAGTRSGEGAYGFGILDATMGAVNISGINAVLDFNQVFTSPLELDSIDSEAAVSHLFSVGPTDVHSAVKNLQEYSSRMLINHNFELTSLEGNVIDHDTGRTIPGALVDLEIQYREKWYKIDSYVTDTEGLFGPTMPDFTEQDYEYRFVASTDNRGKGDPVYVEPDVGRVDIHMPPHGKLTYNITDDTGLALPAKISLYQGVKRTHQFFVWGEGQEDVPPGVYDISVSRGFEYSLHSAQVEIPANGSAHLDASLTRIIDTAGYLSIDTHVHAAPSPDSNVFIPLRVRNAAAVGLEIPVATDHEVIIGLNSGIEETGLNMWVNTITGQEVTATLPEHLTMFPVEPDGTIRGGIIEWYQLGLPELYDEIYSRGAQIAIINHPHILNLLEWDPIAGEPSIEDYSVLQLTKSEAPWSWNFDGVELMNGPKSPFRSIGRGLFDNWMSFHNHGHRIIGVGASDSHGLNDLGMPRTYFESPTDEPDEFIPQDAVDAFKNGKLLISAGAFARVSINGGAGGIGDIITDSDGSIDIHILASAMPEIDLIHIRIYSNCDEVMKIPATDPYGVTKYDDYVSLPLSNDAHIVVAGFGLDPMPRGISQYDPKNVPRFLTNPVYIDADGNGLFDPPGGKECTYTLDD